MNRKQTYIESKSCKRPNLKQIAFRILYPFHQSTRAVLPWYIWLQSTTWHFVHHTGIDRGQAQAVKAKIQGEY